MKFTIIASVACLMTAQAVNIKREAISTTAAGNGGLDVYSSTENENRVQELRQIEFKAQSAKEQAEFDAAQMMEKKRISLEQERAQFDYQNSAGITHPFVDQNGRSFYAVETHKPIHFGEVHETYDIEN